jgi:hypothetical protein
VAGPLDGHTPEFFEPSSSSSLIPLGTEFSVQYVQGQFIANVVSDVINLTQATGAFGTIPLPSFAH